MFLLVFEVHEQFLFCLFGEAPVWLRPHTSECGLMVVVHEPVGPVCVPGSGRPLQVLAPLELCSGIFLFGRRDGGARHSALHGGRFYCTLHDGRVFLVCCGALSEAVCSGQPSS